MKSPRSLGAALRRSPESLLPLLGVAALAAPSASAFQGEPGRELPAPASAPESDATLVEEPREHVGERLDPSSFGPVLIETMDEVMARQREIGFENPPNPKLRNGAQGEWEVPSMRFAKGAHSGTKHLINRWGDTRIGIGFPAPVDLAGAWIAGQGTGGAWATGLQAVGYRDGVEVARSDWFETIAREPSWFEMDLAGIDRVVFLARAAIQGSGWYALDDLTYSSTDARGERRAVVLDFEDLEFRTRLLGTGYAGLTWEQGTGDFDQEAEVRVVPPPSTPPGHDASENELDDPGSPKGGGGTSPTVLSEFIGAKFGDAGANLVPPDTCGAVGPTHFVAGTNANLSVYVKATGVRVVNTSLGNFWSSGAFIGDPRVVYDEHHGRWVVIASDFSDGIYFAYSLTSDATGAWFKSYIDEAQGSDNGKWPDYPTLGVDANGIYTASYMVGSGNTMSIFAIDKAPLLSGSPSFGTVTAFRGLPWEGAIQPAVTHGDSGGVYLVSRRSSTTLRLRQITGPLNAPSLIQKGNVSVPSHGSAPDADQMGTSAKLSTIDYRPMNSVYRNGSVWTAHCINVSGRPGVRWYEINSATATTAQVGTISDSLLHYYMPGIDVNAGNEMVIGFSGSSNSHFAGAYLTGRVPGDPLGQTGPPVLYKAGEAPYTQLTSSGTNRWGDYSLTTIDPDDDTTFWTIQQYARVGNSWVTRVASAEMTDCNVSVYCTPKISSNLCAPVIDGVGVPSKANPAGFTLDTTLMERNSNSLTFFGVGGPAGTPFQGGFLCVAGTVFRLPLQNSGFVPDCTGSISYSLADLLAHPAGGPLLNVGVQVNAQTWGRDPADPFTTSLSSGLQFDVCP